jgi:hypothetical protein
VLVIVDTTEFKKDRFLADNAFRLLLRGSERRDFRVAIGEVTIREAVNHVRASGEKALGELDRALKALRNLRQPLAPKISTDLTAQTIADSYEVFLRRELTRHDVQIAPLPTVSHDAVLRRALDRRKPFDAKGHDGYRDALLWETIRELSKQSSEPIAFITNNHGDFGDGGAGSTLASSLMSEAPDARITRWDSLEAFTAAHVQPVLEVVDELNTRLLADDVLLRDLEQALRGQAALKDADASWIDPRALFDDVDIADYALEESRLLSLGAPVALEIANARIFDPHEVLLDISAEAEGEIALTAWRTGDRGLRHLVDGSALRTRVEVTASAHLAVRAEGIYRPATKTIDSVRIVSASTLFDEEEERARRFREYRRLRPENEAWEHSARQAAASCAEAERYDSVHAGGLGSLRLRDGFGREAIIEFVAHPTMRGLEAAVQHLDISRQMIGPTTRGLLVVPGPLSAHLMQRLLDALDPLLELLAFVDGRLETLQAAQ